MKASNNVASTEAQPQDDITLGVASVVTKGNRTREEMTGGSLPAGLADE